MLSLSAGVGWGWEGEGKGGGKRGGGERRGEGRGREAGFSPICCCPCCHRDETLLIHSAYEQILSAAANKGERKKVVEVQETAAQAIQHA